MFRWKRWQRIRRHLNPRALVLRICINSACDVLRRRHPRRWGRRRTWEDLALHVEDLADAHVKALGVLRPGEQRFYNAGTGHGASVREIVEVSRKVTGHPIPVIEEDRRAGDVPRLYADASKIQEELGWTPKHKDLSGIIASAWAWHESHPHGFDDRPSDPTP